MGMLLQVTNALSQLGSTIRSGALIGKRWLRARAAEADKQKAKMN